MTCSGINLPSICFLFRTVFFTTRRRHVILSSARIDALRNACNREKGLTRQDCSSTFPSKSLDEYAAKYANVSTASQFGRRGEQSLAEQSLPSSNTNANRGPGKWIVFNVYYTQMRSFAGDCFHELMVEANIKYASRVTYYSCHNIHKRIQSSDHRKVCLC